MSSAKSGSGGSSSGSSSSAAKRATGDVPLNIKRASGGGIKIADKPTASSAGKSVSPPAAGAAAAPAKKKPADSAAAVTKGVAGLKVADSPPAEKRRIGVASRRRGDDEPAAAAPAPAAASASSASASKASDASALSSAKANQARRRLSVTAGQADKVDGHAADGASSDPLVKVLNSMRNTTAAPAQASVSSAAAAGASAGSAAKAKRKPFSHFASLSKVGYVPFNPNKVNQDRSVEIARFMNNDDKAFFGVFDGHGAHGHDVSSFLIQELPKHFCLQYGTAVLRPDGKHTLVEELREGMLLVGSKGAPVRIAKAEPGHTERMFRVAYADSEGEGHTVTADHKLVLRWGLNPVVSTHAAVEGNELRVAFLDAASLEWQEHQVPCSDVASLSAEQAQVLAFSWLEQQSSVRALRAGDLFEVQAHRFHALNSFVKEHTSLPLIGQVQPLALPMEAAELPSAVRSKLLVAASSTYQAASSVHRAPVVYQLDSALELAGERTHALHQLERAWAALDCDAAASGIMLDASSSDETAPLSKAELEAALSSLQDGGVLVAFGARSRSAWLQHWRDLSVSGELQVDSDFDALLQLQLADGKSATVRLAPVASAGWQYPELLRVLSKVHAVSPSTLSTALKTAPAFSRGLRSVHPVEGGQFMQVEVCSADELFVLADGVLTHNSKQSNLDSAPHDAITKAFIDCNVKLAASAIDCTFSGSTGIVVYLSNGKIYSCNCGDSRAVLARSSPNSASGETKLTAVALSSDQKPEREDEKKRILECKGRVEACKGARGEDIGPPRVWLSHQDVPGLAMSRSFGDLIAASVGVIAKPEIWEREQSEQDRFMILASDGVWEFIDNQAAVDLVASATARGGPEEAAKALVDEATKRWHAEEEVVDDITCCIVYF